MQLNLSGPAGRRNWLICVASLAMGSVTAATTSDTAQGYNGSGARGYNGSGVRGYNGSGVRGYNGSGARGYNGSGARGYNGSGARGYNGSGARGYNGSGARGYNGSGARGYNGSGARGYNGSGARGYNGSGARGYNGSGAPRDSQVGSVCRQFGEGFSVAAMGSVDAISQNGSIATLVILGQQFEIPADEAATFEVGDFAVAATSPTAGTAAYHAGQSYVAGLSTIRLKAPVTAVDVATGKASLNSASVDYTLLLAVDPETAPQVGESFVVAGTQPLPGGVILAGPDNASAVGCSAPDGRM